MRQLVPPLADTAAGVPDLDALYLQPPGVRLGMVTSVDGAAVLDGASEGLSGDADKQVFRTLRRHCDVVLVGAGTARTERYRPVVVPEEHQARRVSRGQDPVPRIAVLTSGAGLPEDAPLLLPGSGLLLLSPRPVDVPPHVETAVVTGLPDVVEALRARGLTRVLCEGGPTLAGGLLDAGLVDELCLTTSPVLVGGAGPRLVAGAPETARPLDLVSLLQDDDVLLARWKVQT